MNELQQRLTGLLERTTPALAPPYADLVRRAHRRSRIRRTMAAVTAATAVAATGGVMLWSYGPGPERRDSAASDSSSSDGSSASGPFAAIGILSTVTNTGLGIDLAVEGADGRTMTYAVCDLPATTPCGGTRWVPAGPALTFGSTPVTSVTVPTALRGDPKSVEVEKHGGGYRLVSTDENGVYVVRIVLPKSATSDLAAASSRVVTLTVVWGNALGAGIPAAPAEEETQ
ncbi:hypothetical protein [Nocardioides sp. Kera G14]|uniref:hypothetical protein n=1 Tax=Nocardioides sp. Kera G14 TaxID=2884264 RepID=UPI001D0FEFF1|nr:hypothetical protein [Nocardioides sp. Kera G14]UDY25128.1 hypothetical protein LH076_07505 [Nocardioides sp. Kera G14]